MILPGFHVAYRWLHQCGFAVSGVTKCCVYALFRWEVF